MIEPTHEIFRTTELRKLCEDFATTAKEAGIIIIKELFLSYRLKTIKPITNIVGGIAGGNSRYSRFFLTFYKGEKFLHKGIFFKVCGNSLGKK